LIGKTAKKRSEIAGISTSTQHEEPGFDLN